MFGRVDEISDVDSETASYDSDSEASGFESSDHRVTETQAPTASLWSRVRSFEFSPSLVYLLLGVPFSLFFALAIPPSQVLDESAHWYRVWNISEGDIVADVVSPGGEISVNSGTYPPCVRSYVEEFSTLATTPSPFVFEDFWIDTPTCTPGETVVVPGEAMGPYSVWTYPGQTVGVSVGRVLGLPLPAIFYLGRLCGMAASIAMCWYAIRRAPRAKMALTVVALLPMALMGGVGYSPDGLVLGASLIVMSFALRLRFDEVRISNRSYAIATVALTALALTKPPYFVLAGLFVLARPGAFGSLSSTRKRLLGASVFALLAAVVWSRIGYPQGAIEAYRPEIDQAGQVRWILANPHEYLNVVGDTFLGAPSQDFVLRGWVGAFGMFRSGLPESPLILPVFVYVAAIGLAWFTSAEAAGRRKFSGRYDQLASFAPFVVLGVAVLGIYTSAYVAWDSVGASRIFGVQGRYFVPLLPLPAIGLAVRAASEPVPRRLRTLAAFSVVPLFGAVAKIHFYFY